VRGGCANSPVKAFAQTFFLGAFVASPTDSVAGAIVVTLDGSSPPCGGHGGEVGEMTAAGDAGRTSPGPGELAVPEAALAAGGETGGKVVREGSGGGGESERAGNTWKSDGSSSNSEGTAMSRASSREGPPLCKDA